MAGIECAGLVLGVLPLVIEVAKAYKHGVDTILDAVSSSRRDDKLEEFFAELWWETTFLNRQLRDIIHALPILTEDDKVHLLKAENLSQWTTDIKVKESLQEFFNSENDFNAFIVIMSKIVKLLAQLVKNTSTEIKKEDLDQEGLYQKLKLFEEERRTQTTSSTMAQRFKFWKKEKDRKICLKAFRTWNKNLLCLTEEARREPMVKQTKSRTRRSPSPQLREVSRTLYMALARYWRCSCPCPHEAQLCLMPKESALQTTSSSPTDFDFFFSTTNIAGQAAVSWMEGTVLLRSSVEMSKYECAALNRICDAFRNEMGNHCLNFLVEQTGDESTIWQLRPQPRKSSILKSIPAVSLHFLICNSYRLPLVAKRKLAVILARSLLQLHEGLWLGRQWSKQQIKFFYEAVDTIDYQRPYVTTCFDGTDQDKPDFNLFHRNATILALGIMLIEIHTGKPIESYRKSEDLTNGIGINVNTDWTVADRVAKSLDDCSLGYKEAIQACLDTPWVPAAQRISLDDELTRNGFFNDVVQPLEDELQHLFREKF